MTTLSSITAQAQENQWFNISMDTSDARYTPNNDVYKTDDGYINNWVRVDYVTEEAQLREGCINKTMLMQYKSDFHEYRLVALQLYDFEGNVISSEEDYNAQWYHVMPDSTIEWLAAMAKGLWNLHH